MNSKSSLRSSFNTIKSDVDDLLKKIEDYRNHQSKMREMYQNQIQQYNSRFNKQNT